MRFPAVTICNLNPLRYSFVRDDAILMSAVQVAADKWNISLDKFEGSGDTYNVSIFECHRENIYAFVLILHIFTTLYYVYIVYLLNKI